MHLRYVRYPLLTLAFGACRAFGNCTYEVRDLEAAIVGDWFRPNCY